MSLECSLAVGIQNLPDGFKKQQGLGTPGPLCRARAVGAWGAGLPSLHFSATSPHPPVSTAGTPEDGPCCCGARAHFPSSASQTWPPIRTAWEFSKIPEPKPHPRLISHSHCGRTQVAAISEAAPRGIPNCADKSETHCCVLSCVLGPELSAHPGPRTLPSLRRRIAAQGAGCAAGVFSSVCFLLLRILCCCYCYILVQFLVFQKN